MKFIDTFNKMILEYRALDKSLRATEFLFSREMASSTAQALLRQYPFWGTVISVKEKLRFMETFAE